MMRRVCLAYGLLGLGLWPVPLLNVLQVESAAVVALVAFFVAGTAAVAAFRGGEASVRLVLVRQEAALLIPLGMLLVAPLWAPNCTLGQGLLFYALFPGGTVVLAVALAYALTGMGLARPTLALCGIGLAVALMGPIYDLGFHPQFYTYNHVFGGVLGPIYDEQLAVRPGLFAFRGLTLLWAGAAYLAGRWLRGEGGGTGLLASLAAIALVYGFGVPLGINTSAEHLQRRLGGHVRTAHFDIYFDSTRTSRRAVRAMADDHEAYYDHLQTELGLGPTEGPERIQSYLYPGPAVKARLTGARTTSVSPVWLAEPQVHLLVDRVDQSLGHELAHVFSRPYGLPVLRASWSPGLVEGWAVALEPPSAVPSAHDLVRVATATDTTQALSLTGDALADRLTPWGFWTGRGAVSYATMGSFVRYLLDRYGPARLRRVYATGNFEAVYGRPLRGLVRDWTQMLRDAPAVPRAAYDVVARTFTVPSLFETECPHYVPPHRRHLQAARRAQRAGDTTRAASHLRRAQEAAPRSVPVHAALARHRLRQGRAGAVRRQLDSVAVSRRTASLWRLLADAHALRGEAATARQQYEQALERVPLYAHDGRARLMLRVAVADHPAAVRVLTGGRGGAEQAAALAALDEGDGPTLQAWRALRLQDDHRYGRADSLWGRVPPTLPAPGPQSWQVAYRIQRRGWAAEAAARAGRGGAARCRAREAARQARAHGAEAWAETLEAWADRADREGATQGDPPPPPPR